MSLPVLVNSSARPAVAHIRSHHCSQWTSTQSCGGVRQPLPGRQHRLCRTHASLGTAAAEVVPVLAALPAALSALSLPSFQLDPSWYPLLAAAIPIGGVLGWRVSLYGQLEYITASMLGKYVPRGGARIIQIGGGPRELYYYPKDSVLVTFVGEKANKGLLEQAGIQAALPVMVRKQAPDSLSFQGGSSIDAVIVLNSLQGIKNPAAFLKEVLRVLRPGRPLVFVERVKGDGVEAAAQLLLGNAFAALDPEALQKLRRTPGFSSVEGDIALQGLDPHAVGVAIKSEQYRGQDDDDVDAAAALRKVKGRKRAVKAEKGFS